MKLKIFLTVFIALGFTVSQAQPAKPIPGQYIVILKESAATPVIKQETQIITVCKRPQITLWSSILASLNHVAIYDIPGDLKMHQINAHHSRMVWKGYRSIQ